MPEDTAKLLNDIYDSVDVCYPMEIINQYIAFKLHPTFNILATTKQISPPV